MKKFLAIAILAAGCASAPTTPEQAAARRAYGLCLLANSQNPNGFAACAHLQPGPAPARAVSMGLAASTQTVPTHYQLVQEADRRLFAVASINIPPQKLDGTYSYEFEPQDVTAAQEATNLVKLYCGGITSEAQRLGCLSHITQSQVCYRQPDTGAQGFARMLFAAKYGYVPC